MFYHLDVSNQINIDGGPLYGTKYLLEYACDCCGTGAIPIGPLFLRKFKIPKYQIFCTLNREILLQSNIKDALIKNGIKSFGEVYEVKSQKQMPIWELRSQKILPQFSPETTGFERELPCSTCNRDGYFGIPHTPLNLKYILKDKSLLDKDVYVTYECFGNSRLREPFKQSVFAAPLFIVSHRVMKCFKELNVKNVEFEEVTIE